MAVRSRNSRYGSIIREQALLLALLLSAVIPVTLPLVSVYRVHGDDFAPVFYSSAPYFDISEWHTWFTKGWSEYFLNYEGWPALGTDFVRPVVNLSLYLQGKLAPSIGDAAYLIGNYLALTGTVLLVNVLLRRYSKTGSALRVILSFSVGLSPVWYPDLTEASFATNAFACFFGVASLVVLDAPRGASRGWRLWACIVLQIMAVWSHETAVVVPFVSLWLLAAYSTSRLSVRDAAPFAVPVVVMALSRLVVSGEGGVYALQPGPLSSTAKRLAGFLFAPPVPFDLDRALSVLAGGQSLATTAAYGLAIVANAALILSVALALFRSPSRQAHWALLGAFVFARMPGALGRMDPRFLGIALAVALLAFVTITEQGRGRSWRNAVLLLLLVSQAALLLVEVYVPRAQAVASLERAGVFFDSTRDAISDAAPDVVVLINDDVAFYASRAMLEMAAWPNQNVRPVVINSYEGKPDAGASASISVVDDALVVRTAFAPGQRAFFAGSVPDFTVPANGFTYEQVSEAQGPYAAAFTTRGAIASGRTLVLGVDPRDGTFLEPKVY